VMTGLISGPPTSYDPTASSSCSTDSTGSVLTLTRSVMRRVGGMNRFCRVGGCEELDDGV